MNKLKQSAMDQIIETIGRNRMFTVVEEIECAKLMMLPCAIGRAAQNRMVTANLRLVLSHVRKIKIKYPTELPFEDLYGEGILGLKRATELFDYRKGFKFSTYATWWVRQAILRAIETKGRSVYLPVGLRAKHRKLKKAQTALEQQKGRHVSRQELADFTGNSVAYVSKMHDHFRPIKSLDAPVAGNLDQPLLTLVPDQRQSATDQIHEQDLRDNLEILLAEKLHPTQLAVIYRTYGLAGHQPRSHESIAEELGVSLKELKTIRVSAIRKLRHPATIAVLARWL